MNNIGKIVQVIGPVVDIKFEELIALGTYYHRPAYELIFLTKKEHSLLHKSRKGKHHTEETRRKISEAHKGMKYSEEYKRKLSEAQKGRRHSEETKKKMSEAKKGKHWKLVDGKRVYY